MASGSVMASESIAYRLFYRNSVDRHPAGRHAIEFRYLPQSFVQGVHISSIRILVMAALLVPQMRLSLYNLEIIRCLNDFRLGNHSGVFLALFLVGIARYCVSLRSF
jgi:hypothetical protein